MTRAPRVLHIASGDLWAGAEVQAFTLMSHLARMPGVEVAAVLMNRGVLADKLGRIGLQVFVLDEEKTKSLRLFSYLRGVLRRWRPDVIHTHRQKENILGALANRSCRNVPSVRTVHGDREYGAAAGLRGIRTRVLTDLDRWCGRSLQQRIIAVTRELGLKLQQEYPSGKITVIENGVDFEQVRRDRMSAEFREKEPDATHIGIAGRLVEVKRVDLFVETAALLVREHPERTWRFHVFGEGPKRRELEELAGRLQLADKAFFHGHRQDIATCLGGLDALVICSDHEGMPMVSLEAAALGVPTVAHAVGGLVDIVPEAFLVRRHDANGYKEGILRALGEDGRDLAQSDAVRTVERYSAVRNAERVRALYEELVAGNFDGLSDR